MPRMRLAREALGWNGPHYAHLLLARVPGEGEGLQVKAHINSIKFGPLDLALNLSLSGWPFNAPIVTVLGDRPIDHPLVDPATRTFLALKWEPSFVLATFLMALQVDIIDADVPLMLESAEEIRNRNRNKRKHPASTSCSKLSRHA